MQFLAPLIIAGAIVGIFYAAIMPLYADTEDLRARTQKLDDALAQADEIIALRDTLLARYNSITPEDLERLEKLIPPTSETVPFILTLSELSKTNALVLEDVKLIPSNELRARGSTVTAEDALHEVSALEFTVTGTYQSFRNFLSTLEKNVRLSDTTLVSFTTPPGAQFNNINRYRVLVQSYWLK